VSARSGGHGGKLALAAVSVALLACRKPPPAEIVYTGKGPVLEPALPASLLPAGGPGGAPSRSGGVSGTDSSPAVAGVAASNSGSASNDASTPVTACVRPAVASGPFSKAQLIGAAADCAIWHYCEFESGARTLEASARTYRDDPSPGNLERAQQAFFGAAGSWQRAELFRFGPAARSAEPGGADLRDLIYAWPVRAECKVDEQTVSQSYASPEFHSLDFGASPVTGRTLTALEYLLFNPALQNRCSAYATINASGSWSALAAEELRARRRAYAAEAAADVRARAEALTRAWSESGGGFRGRFVQSGPDNPTFKSEQQVLNTVSNALFYLDLELKDLKLATPLGLTPECAAAVCPDAVESRYTDASLAYVRENLVGFRRLFQGCGADYAGVGFDDWLRAAGGGELAERMLASLAAVDVAVAQVPGSLAQALITHRELPLGVHAAVKAVSDELKTEFVTLLNLELPAASEGDND
jgi:predicted lipoprotein